MPAPAVHMLSRCRSRVHPSRMGPAKAWHPARTLNASGPTTYHLPSTTNQTMSDLITTARAKYNLNNLTTTAAEDTTLAALVMACSKAIRKFCGREFDSQQFDELYHGNGHHRLLLRQFPIISVARVAYAPTTVLRIRNTSSANQRATVAVTSTGLSLTRVASGTSSTDTSVTWAGNATLTAVATAVNALGNGWTATVADTSFNLRASADLRSVQGALDTKDVDAEL